MKDVNDYRARMRTILGDAAGRRYTDEMLDAGLSQALEQLRKYLPCRETIRAKVEGYDGDLAVLRGTLCPEDEILTVRQLSSGRTLNAVPLCVDGKMLLRIYGGPPLPAPGETLTLELGRPYAVRGLDGGTVTNVPDPWHLMVAGGAAGWSARIRARSVTEVFGKRPEDREALMRQAGELIGAFEKELKERAEREAFMLSPWPERGFPV